MSKISADNISNKDDTLEVPTETVIAGSAKAWVYIVTSTGTPVIQDSFNVSSITDNGTGNYTVNFTVAFADVNYASIMGSTAYHFRDYLNRTVSSIDVATFNSTPVLTDYDNNSVAILTN